MDEVAGFVWGTARRFLLAVTPFIAFAFLAGSFGRDFSKSERIAFLAVGMVVALLSMVFYGLLIGSDNLAGFGLYPFVAIVSLILNAMRKVLGEYSPLAFFILIFVVGPLAAKLLFRK